MPNTMFGRAGFLAISCLLSLASPVWADQEDWAEARKATCPELVEAYKTTSGAEAKVVAAMKSSKNGTVAGNVLGVATLAIVGFGFFSWHDDSSAEENLAELRNDLKIIRAVAAEKKCELPAAP